MTRTRRAPARPWHLLACDADFPRLYGGGNNSVSAAGEIVEL
jgi:hypothetical protein